MRLALSGSSLLSSLLARRLSGSPSRRVGPALFSRASSSSSAYSVRGLAANLSCARDVEDFALTYGLSDAAGASFLGGGVRRLAVVKVGGEVITKEAATLVASLRVLSAAGLRPVVVHGGGPQLNDELAKAGVKPEYIGGHRVTTPSTMAVAERVFLAANAELCAALVAGGLEPGAVLSGAFKAHVPAGSKLGLVGEIDAVDASAVEAHLAAGRVPILTSLGVGKCVRMGGVGAIQLLMGPRMIERSDWHFCALVDADDACFVGRGEPFFSALQHVCRRPRKPQRGAGDASVFLPLNWQLLSTSSALC